jgi:hypothetical protein
VPATGTSCCAELPVEDVVVVSVCALVPLEDGLRCLYRWSLDPLDGALALVSSEFLPLGQIVFRRSCAGGVLYILCV